VHGQDVLGEAAVQGLVRPVQQQEGDVEAAQHGAAELDVLGDGLGAGVVAAGGVGGCNDGGAGWQGGAHPRLGSRHLLLLQSAKECLPRCPLSLGSMVTWEVFQGNSGYSGIGFMQILVALDPTAYGNAAL